MEPVLGSRRIGLRFLAEIENPVRGVLQLSAIVGIGAALDEVAAAPARPGPLEELILLCLACHVALFAVSTAYHCLPWPPASKARMQRLDHVMIYAKIAASIGPLAWVAHGVLVATSLIALSWTIATVGALQKLFWPGVAPRLSSYVQVAQAALMLPALLRVGATAPSEAALPLAVAGLCYAVGGAVFLLERPVLWPHRFSYHELFHTLVVAGGLALATALQRLPSLSFADG